MGSCSRCSHADPAAADARPLQKKRSANSYDAYEALRRPTTNNARQREGEGPASQGNPWTKVRAVARDTLQPAASPRTLVVRFSVSQPPHFSFFPLLNPVVSRSPLNAAAHSLFVFPALSPLLFSSSLFSPPHPFHFPSLLRSLLGPRRPLLRFFRLAGLLGCHAERTAWLCSQLQSNDFFRRVVPRRPLRRLFPLRLCPSKRPPLSFVPFWPAGPRSISNPYCALRPSPSTPFHPLACPLFPTPHATRPQPNPCHPL